MSPHYPSGTPKPGQTPPASVPIPPARPPVPAAGRPGRSAAEIRRDIDVQRIELGRSVEVLRTRVGELTDWRRQVEEHKRELIIGAAVVGFAIGGLAMLRRRGS
jgi:hypothetical protein